MFEVVDISMGVICDASDITRYDRSTLELCNAALHMTQDTTRIEKYPPKPKPKFRLTYTREYHPVHNHQI